MSKRFSITLAVAVAGLACVQGASAQSVTQVNQVSRMDRQPTQQGMQGRQNMQGRPGKQKKMALMPGDVAKENIQKVTSEIRWNSNLNSALAQAHRQNKMVLWVHLVGNLSGAT